MIKRLRLHMMILHASITGVILVVLSVISLHISEVQLLERGQALFENNTRIVSFQISNDSVLEWSWLQRMRSEGNLDIYIEDNGQPILFGKLGRDSIDQDLLKTARNRAAHLGADTTKRPLSALKRDEAFFRIDRQGEIYRAGVVVFRTQSGYKSLTVLGDTQQEAVEIHKQRVQYGVLSLAFLAVATLFSWWFSGRAIRPVEKSRQLQAEFIAAASHELRTPLAVIGTSASALRNMVTQQGCGFVSTIEGECARTGKLVDDLLILSNADACTWSMENAPVELGSLLEDVVTAFQATAGEKSQQLTLTPLPSLPLVLGDESRLTQLLSVLLDNACHYTPEGGLIQMSAQANTRYLHLMVADNGPGIPPEQRESVFRRFFRGDASRSPKAHYGLGLSIAREIVDLHNGKILISDTPGGGLTVTVQLPVLR